MEKHHISDETVGLMHTYLSGNATDDQVVTLENWVQADPLNKAAFIEYKKSWMLSAISQSQNKTDLNREWSKINKQIKTSGKVVRLKNKKSSTRRWMSVAAGIALLIAAALWMINPFHSDPTMAYKTSENHRMEQLADGSTIHLNQHSEYSFNNATADSQTRNSQLTGDAFFDIKRDEEHPFEILAGNMNITVLGTSFYVDARPDEEKSQVMVNSGKVSVKANGQTVILKKGETATFDKTSKQLVKTTTIDNNYLGWTNNTLNFDNTTLKEVVFTLNRHYHSNISIENEAINNCKITAQYKNKSLEAVIKIIEATLGIEAIISDKSILLKGSDC